MDTCSGHVQGKWCFRMERLGDCSIESATAVTFSCAVLVLGQPDLLLFNADDVCQKLETQRCIVFPVGTGSGRFNEKCLQKERCVATTDSPFFTNSSVTKARCSPLHAINAAFN